MVKNCPICGSKLIRKENEAAYYCVNQSCDARRIEGLIHFVSRNAMNMDGFGEKIIEDFYNMGYLKYFYDFYHLKEYKDDLKNLEGFGEKSIQNLLNGIEESKKNDLDRFLFALGIRHVGKKTAGILAKKYRNIDNLINADYLELVDIPDIGTTIAKSVSEYFSKNENIELINKLKQLGVNMEYNKKEEEKDSAFSNKTFVLTGTLSKMTRDEAIEKIESLGGKTTSTVTRKTDFVIVGDNPGSKYEKALKLGIKILTEQEFLKNIK